MSNVLQITCLCQRNYKKYELFTKVEVLEKPHMTKFAIKNTKNATNKKKTMCLDVRVDTLCTPSDFREVIPPGNLNIGFKRPVL